MICLPILREFDFAKFRFLCARIFFRFRRENLCETCALSKRFKCGSQGIFCGKFFIFIVIAKSLAVNVSFRHLIL